MIYLRLLHHNYEYEIKEFLKQYFRNEEIRTIGQLTSPLKEEDPFVITNGLSKIGSRTLFYSRIERGNEVISNAETMKDSNSFNTDSAKTKWEKIYLKITLYKAMERGFKRKLPWGILTGIRPSKIVHSLLDRGLDRKDITNQLKYQYLVSDNKSDLLLKVAENEREILYPYDKKKVSIYVGIPFCPTKCIYCSFVSNVLGKDREILKDYINALCLEIREIARYLKKHRIDVESLYIGGGTPTILDHVGLEYLLDFISGVLDIDKIEEYTLEAGRPDTIDEKKLEIALDHGVNRISINPQTMNEKTLDRIGRRYSPKDIKKTYYIAKQMGFSIINMDLILGLPGESIEEVKKTLEEIITLEPENITIHTMSIKRGSKLKEQEDPFFFQREEVVLSMLEYTQMFLEKNAYQPYYLYRQKYMMGNLENVGYCMGNCKSIYNIQMMGDKQTIIGLGAGATTKLIFIEENRIERMINIKNVSLYIERLQEMLDRKLELLDTLYQ